MGRFKEFEFHDIVQDAVYSYVVGKSGDGPWDHTIFFNAGASFTPQLWCFSASYNSVADHSIIGSVQMM